MLEDPALPSPLGTGLQKTRATFFERITRLLTRTRVDANLLEQIEEILITADVGISATRLLLDALPVGVSEPEELLEALKRQITAILSTPRESISEGSPHVVLALGVNGVGKTTTIGKLAFRATRQGKRVLLAAADTFRAAAIAQLQVWGQRAGADVIAHQQGGDPAAVVFDALQAAEARKADLLLIDTAGRLHTKRSLMEELKKIHRVLGRSIPGAPHETLLILDGTTGLNAALQVREFHEAIGITGLIITKLDGTAKGGAVVGIVAELQIPVRYVGLGEGIEDLVPFSASAFGAALFARSA